MFKIGQQLSVDRHGHAQRNVRGWELILRFQWDSLSTGWGNDDQLELFSQISVLMGNQDFLQAERSF